MAWHVFSKRTGFQEVSRTYRDRDGFHGRNWRSHRDGHRKTVFRSAPRAEIEDLFGHLEFGPALAAGGVLIVIAGVFAQRQSTGAVSEKNALSMKQAALIGAIQELCPPFRGFSRSGATISLGMLLGVAKAGAESFSFALAVVLTPPVVAREVIRLIHSTHANGGAELASVALPSLLGAVVAFLAGLLALR